MTGKSILLAKKKMFCFQALPPFLALKNIAPFEEKILMISILSYTEEKRE